MAANTAFETLLNELSATRSAYENLRASNGPLADRASTLTHLHNLRASIAALR